jgi:hypothetical protein
VENVQESKSFVNKFYETDICGYYRADPFEVRLLEPNF